MGKLLFNSDELSNHMLLFKVCQVNNTILNKVTSQTGKVTTHTYKQLTKEMSLTIKE